MGALCSGKSENPGSLEPSRPNLRATNNVGGVPKVAYGHEKSNSAIPSDDKITTFE
jgi:hypothetical protein